MRLSISNIAWESAQDSRVYEMMKKYRYTGLEIAPTKIFPDTPYERLQEALEWRKCLEEEHGFVIPSIQSIWFGRQEKLFGTSKERQLLIDYTKKAIDFAVIIGCKNLVFGCPHNRMLPDGRNPDKALPFFQELGDYAYANGAVIGMEANPPIYNTNYINDTLSALELIKKVGSKGFLLNLDVGTMIQNQEDVKELIGEVKYINHVHISEPGLKLIEKRELHRELYHLLKQEGYSGYISIEMGKTENISTIENAVSYVAKCFL